MNAAKIRNTVKIIGACCKYGQKRRGVELAPYIVEKALNISIAKIKDTDGSFDYDSLYCLHQRELNSNLVITIGGDHSISYSTVSSALDLYKDSLHVIWVDAHADINTQSTSVTGSIHGMPVGHLMGFETHPIATFQAPILDASQITYVGIRDLDPPEVKRIAEYNISTALEQVPKDKNIYLSIDVDSLDPREFPCTGTPVYDGINLNDLLDIIHRFKDRTVAVDLVEFNPLVNAKYADMCAQKMKHIIHNIQNII